MDKKALVYLTLDGIPRLVFDHDVDDEVPWIAYERQLFGKNCQSAMAPADQTSNRTIVT